MNFGMIAMIMLLSTISLYIAFLVLGVGGIPKNRSAQGLDQNQKSDE